MVGKSFGLSVEIVLEYVKVLNSTTPLSSYGKNLKRILVLYHQVKTSVNLKFQLSIINKDPSQLVPQSTEGDFRDLWPLINMIIVSSHDMSPALKYSPSQLRDWPRRRRSYGHGHMSVKAPPSPLRSFSREFLPKNALKLCFFPKKHRFFSNKSYGFGGLVWWMSGVVDI